MRRIKLPVFLFILAAAMWYGEQWVPAEYVPWADYTVKMAFLVASGFLAAIFIFTWLEYRLYTYTFTDEAFVITSGLAMRKEVAALYHQIQNVNINRSPMNRMIGVSEIVIIMNGASHDQEHAKLILPAVARMKAKLVQKELLTRARRHTSQPVQATAE